jgi:uncharacterized protein (DUF934 family)
MTLYKSGEFIEDHWRNATPETPAADESGVVLSLQAWKAARESLAGTNHPLGLRIEAGEMVDDLLADLPRFSMIALVFPKFNDGRAFSKAKLLRDHGFGGEVRAVGDVLWDQLQLMARCGFDAFEISNEPTLAALRGGKKPFMTAFGQPGFGPETKEGAPRAWTRRAL